VAGLVRGGALDVFSFGSPYSRKTLVPSRCSSIGTKGSAPVGVAMRAIVVDLRGRPVLSHCVTRVGAREVLGDGVRSAGDPRGLEPVERLAGHGKGREQGDEHACTLRRAAFGSGFG
jgi:hypothetical protein